MRRRQHIALLFAALVLAASAQQPEDSGWVPVQTEITVAESARVLPVRYTAFKADEKKITRFSQNVVSQQAVITLPTPDGRYERFSVTEEPVLDSGLEGSFPGIRSYNLKGIDDPHANGKLDVNSTGIYAMLFSPRGDFFIDPVNTTSGRRYICYYRKDFTSAERRNEPPFEQPLNIKRRGTKAYAPCIGGSIINFRLAVSCTHQYAMSVSGNAVPTIGEVLAKIAVTINRVNGVLERDVGVHLVLVPTTTAVIFTSALTDPFQKPTNLFGMLKQSQAILDSLIGTDNYDIGHTFSAAGGGLAVIGGLCSQLFKGQGVTGRSNPSGDPFDIDYVAHEMGHQLGANHTFNSTAGFCGNNRAAHTAVEPGSGITIMGYAGLCGSDNIGSHSIPYLHAVSYDEIVHFTRMVNENGCGTQESTGNSAPVVSPLDKLHYIPRETPFRLSGSASDPNGDLLSYSWEEVSSGKSAGPWNADINPYFRSYAPDTLPTRYFPSEAVVLSGDFKNTPGEFLSGKEQKLAFRFTVRDNRIGGGGVCSDSTKVQLTAAGPFTVMVPQSSTTWEHGTEQLVCWNVNYTNAPPVDCRRVTIRFSDDNGKTYQTLASKTENDGYEKITLPVVPEKRTLCRIRIDAVDKIFYAMSDPFSLTPEKITSLTTAGSPPLKVAVWPNPTSDHLTIWLGDAINLPIHLVDVTGRLLKTIHVAAGESVIPISEIPAGIYLLRFPGVPGSPAIRLVKH